MRGIRWNLVVYHAANRSLRRHSNRFGYVWVAVVKMLEYRNEAPLHRVFRDAKGVERGDERRVERGVGSGKAMARTR